MLKKYRKFATVTCLASIAISCLWLFFPIAEKDFGNDKGVVAYFIHEDVETLLVFLGIMALEVLFLLIPKMGFRIAASIFSVMKGGFLWLLLKAVEMLGYTIYTVLPGSSYDPYTLTITAFAYLFLGFNGLSLVLHIVSMCFLAKEKRLEKEVSPV